MEFIAVIIDLWKLTKRVVVAQLAEWLFSTPEVCSSHQIVGDFLHKTFTVSQLSWKRAKLKKNEADNSLIKEAGVCTSFKKRLGFAQRLKRGRGLPIVYKGVPDSNKGIERNETITAY